MTAHGRFRDECSTDTAPWFAPHRSAILEKWQLKGNMDTDIVNRLPDEVARDIIECACGARGADVGDEAACRGCSQEQWRRQVTI